MNRILTLVLILMIGANGYYAWQQNENAKPSTAELDADIAAIDAELKEVEAAAKQYQKGLLMMATVRIETLKATRAMLMQKRTAFMRGIDLSYTVDGAPRAEPDPQQLATLEADLKAQRTQVALAEQQVADTKGMFALLGRLQVMVEEMKASMLELAYYSAKYDIPFVKAASEAAAAQQEQLGKAVADPDAL